ncbi:MAG: hypothetical protein WCI73_19010, partial [Phycisphaerae bacterium]
QDFEPKDDTTEAGKLLKTISQGFTVVDPKWVDWNVILRLANDFYDEEAAALRQRDIHQVRAGMAAVSQKIELWKKEVREILTKDGWMIHLGDSIENRSLRFGKLMLAILVFDPSHARILEERCRTERKLLKILLSAAAFKAQTGNWPAKFTDLPQKVLNKLPRDAFSKSGRDLPKYRLLPTGPQVYSVGPNGQDDDGVQNRSLNLDDVCIGALPESIPASTQPAATVPYQTVP